MVSVPISSPLHTLWRAPVLLWVLLIAEGLAAVKNSRFAGKTVIYPHVANLPLTALPDLKAVRPDVYAKLRDGQFWTDAAEAALTG